MNRQTAIDKFDTGWWKTATDREIVDFQLPEERLCMPFGEFHKAVESVLQRPVFTHEFARPDALVDELEGRREPLDPLDSLRQIVPEEKIIVLEAPND